MPKPPSSPAERKKAAALSSTPTAPKAPGKKPKITPLQANFIRLMPLVKSGKLTVEAAMKKAGYADSTAKQQRNTTKAIRSNSVMQEALRKAGVDEQKLAEKVCEGLEATKTFSANFDIHEVPDYNAQHSFVKTAAELLDVVPPKKQINADASLDDLIKTQEGGSPQTA